MLEHPLTPNEYRTGARVPDVSGAAADATRAVVRPIRETVTGDAAIGKGETFRIRPRWPSVAQLDYVQKFSTASLLALGLVVMLLFAIKSPTRAARAIVGAAKAKVGA